MQKIILSAVLTAGLLSCSDPQSGSGKADQINDNKKHMLSDQEKMLQKAKDSEQLIHDAAEKRRKALEDQGG